MKRIFTHIGFSTAVTLLVINLLPVNSISLIMLGLAVLSAASLVIFKGKEKAVFVCLISGVFACGVFLCTYNATVAPQLSLDSAEADTEFYITDITKIDDDGNYVYTVKTTKIDCDGAPQNIKLRVKSTRKINADYYETVKGKLKFYSIADNASSSYGYWGEKIFLSAKGSKFTATGNKINSPWKYTLLLREDIINTLSAQIGGDEGALSAAFLTGENSLLSDKAYTDFVFAGATHLMDFKKNKSKRQGKRTHFGNLCTRLYRRGRIFQICNPCRNNASCNARRQDYKEAFRRAQLAWICGILDMPKSVCCV